MIYIYPHLIFSNLLIGPGIKFDHGSDIYANTLRRQQFVKCWSLFQKQMPKADFSLNISVE